MKIWVLFHGPVDSEHPEAYECQRLKEEAEKLGASLEVMSCEDFDLVIDSTDEWRAIYQGRYIDPPDLIIPRTGAESSYNAYSVLRFYEALKVPMLNNWLAIENVADKLRTHQILASQGFPIPRTILAKLPPDLDMVEEKLGFPVVVKTLRGTRGGGVFLSESREQFKDLTDLIAEANKDVHMLYQEYISRSHGRDLRVFVAGGRILACMERRSTDGSFKSNISRGGSGAPHPVTPAIRDLSLAVTKALNLEVAGIDLLMDGECFKVCEANSAPGFKGLEASCNVNVARELVMLGLSKAKGRTLQGFISRFTKLRVAA